VISRNPSFLEGFIVGGNRETRLTAEMVDEAFLAWLPSAKIPPTLPI